MNEKYKLVCIDLDGTLLTSKHDLSDKTVSYLKELVQRGIHIAIATGRASFDAKFHANFIGDKIHYIASNGASFGRNDQEELIYELDLSDDAITLIKKVSKNFKLKPVYYTKDEMLILGIRNLMLHMAFVLFGAKHLKKHLKYFNSLKSITNYCDSNDLDVQKAIIFSRDTEDLLDIKDMLGETLFDIAVTNKTCIEITPKGVNKAKGVKALCETLGIDKEQVIAFGDSQNDMKMLEFVGLGVAMGNACEEAKKVADEITDSNDEDGIYNKLFQIFG
jgi:Cof subfamily protein (haloacid dehalogenase superfamily)